MGTDFSPASEPALEAARFLANTFEAKLTLLHVHAPQIDALGPAMAVSERMQIGRDLHEALSVLKDRLKGVRHLRAEVVPGEQPAAVICSFAQSHGVDLIVVGSRGLTGVKAMLLGSVAERVLRDASCSVLLAR